MHTTESLYDELRRTFTVIEKQIEATTRDVERQIARLPHSDATIYDWKYGNGQFVLAELLIARAKVISAMAELKAADLKVKAARTTKR